jgi:PIN domain nuclease of toxin-antitoxin system
MTTRRFLLDTCALIYLAEDQSIAIDAQAALRAVEPVTRGIWVSVFSAWEIGMLASKGRLMTAREPRLWFDSAVSKFGAGILGVTTELLLQSSFLPEPLHGDPADRILIATARSYDLTIVTRDRAILTYGAAGNVKVLAC